MGRLPGNLGGILVPGGRIGAVFDPFVSVRHRSSKIFLKFNSRIVSLAPPAATAPGSPALPADEGRLM